MSHIMFDLETWGTRPGSALRSVGACVFSLEGTIGATFYANIEEQSCLDAGLTKDPATVKWWAQQSPEAQAALLVDPLPLEDVVDKFHVFFFRHTGKTLWCQGANFDEPLWCAAARHAGPFNTALGVPWKFWNVRDTRTAYDLGGFDPRTLKRDGTYHNALDDAIHQAKCVQAAVKKLAVAA